MQNMITYEDDAFVYRIEKSKRKTISIAVYANGEVVVKAPYKISNSTIEDVVKKKQDWIIKKRSEAIAQTELKQKMDYLSYKSGSNLLYEGKLYPLNIAHTSKTKHQKVVFTGTSFELEVNNEDAMHVRKIMRDWYREQAREKFRSRVEYYNQYLNIAYGTIRIKEQKGCYGSCSSKGNLNFNWKCILAPKDILDYVVVHELCHLKYFNHSIQFWRLVSSLMPDYKDKISWIKENGRLLEY